MADCPFCNIISGKIPTIKLYEDNLFMASHDINPGNKGHTIIFSKSHKTSLMDLSNSERNHLIHIATQMMSQIKKVTGCGGINMIYSLGELAGQRTDHFILHLIPRFKDDKVFVQWEPKKLEDNDVKEIQEKLTQAFSSVKPPAIQIEKKEEVIKKDKKPKIEEADIPEPKTDYW